MGNRLFSYNSRKKLISEALSQKIDLLVIGGGITGAGIVFDAQLRGLKTVVLEKEDFASGTSSKSTKLIHGGLRYLKNFKFKQVYDVGRERNILHKNATHLVIPKKMILPFYKQKKINKILTIVGLTIYDFLAGVRKTDKRKILSKGKVNLVEPLLNNDAIDGAVFYSEFVTDDARLTLEIMKTAFNNGAITLNYMKVNKFLYKDNKIIGVSVSDKLTNNEYELTANYIINATGPWVDDVAKLDAKVKNKLILTKGIHIVIDKQKLPLKYAIYFEAIDGRMIFAIPRRNVIYVGTTDTFYKKNKEQIHIEKNEVEYLIESVNCYFDSSNLKLKDVKSCWSGLRPLIYEEGKKPSEISRKDEIFISNNGLISIAGGKLTGYRRMSEKVVNLIAKKYKRDYNKKIVKSTTKYALINGNNFFDLKAVKEFTALCLKRVNEKPVTLSEISYLVTTYGTQTELILDAYLKNNANDTDDLKLLKAEFIFCIEHEMVTNPLDFYLRRTGRMYFNLNYVISTYKFVGELYKSVFKIDEFSYKKIMKDLDYEINNHRKFSF